MTEPYGTLTSHGGTDSKVDHDRKVLGSWVVLTQSSHQSQDNALEDLALSLGLQLKDSPLSQTVFFSLMTRIMSSAHQKKGGSHTKKLQKFFCKHALWKDQVIQRSICCLSWGMNLWMVTSTPSLHVSGPNCERGLIFLPSTHLPLIQAGCEQDAFKAPKNPRLTKTHTGIMWLCSTLSNHNAAVIVLTIVCFLKPLMANCHYTDALCVDAEHNEWRDCHVRLYDYFSWQCCLSSLKSEQFS